MLLLTKIQHVFSLNRLLIVRINTKIAYTKKNYGERSLLCQMQKKKFTWFFFEFNENLMQTYSIQNKNDWKSEKRRSTKSKTNALKSAINWLSFNEKKIRWIDITSGIQFSVLIGCSYSLDFIHNQISRDKMRRKQMKCAI